MTETKLLNSYTFLTKKTVYYSVTVGAENVNEAEEIASNLEHCEIYEDTELLEQDEYEVVELLDKEED